MNPDVQTHPLEAVHDKLVDAETQALAIEHNAISAANGIPPLVKTLLETLRLLVDSIRGERHAQPVPPPPDPVNPPA